MNRLDIEMRYISRLVLLTASLALTSASAGAFQRTHDLEVTPERVHWGYYDGGLEPVLTIASGDTVRVETLLARGLERLRLAGAPEDEIPEALKVVEEAIQDRGPGAHPMTGPIYVEGAEPGDVLEVQILGFEFLHPFGVSYFLPGSGTLPDDFPYTRLKLTRFDPETGTVQFAPGITLKLAPFFGSIGVGRTRFSAGSTPTRLDTMSGTSTTRTSSQARRCTCRSMSRVPCSRSATTTVYRATVKSR